MYEDESVLVIKRELFDVLGAFQEYLLKLTNIYLHLGIQIITFLYIRELAEDDPTHKKKSLRNFQTWR